MRNRRSLRRALSLWLALILVLQSWAQLASAADLTDTQDHWARAEIDALVDQGIVRGYEDGTFRPDLPINRAEFVALLNRAAGAQPRGETAAFPDVTARDWFASDVALAAAAGVTTGFQDGTFRPQQPISRQEAAVLLARVLDLAASEAPAFADASEIPAWAAPAVGAVAEAGYMKGYPDGTFAGLQPITRAEAAVLIQRTRPRMLLAMPRRVDVTVVGEQGQPVPGATVRVHKKGEKAYLTGGLSGATGVFVRYLRAGEYEFTAALGTLVGHLSEKVLPGAAAVTLTVAPGATLSGTVIDGAQQPVAGALVALTTNPTFLTVTGQDGRFSASVPANRDYILTVAYFANGQNRFDADLDRFAPYLQLLDNPQATLPGAPPRPSVGQVRPGVTAPGAGQSGPMGDLNAATGQRTPPGENPPPPPPPPPGGTEPPPPPAGGETPPPPPPSGGGGDGGGGKPSPTLKRLDITPSTAIIAIGQTQSFTVTGTLSNGSTRDYTSKVTFTAQPAAVATVSATGVATGVAAGAATVTAAVGGITATADLDVISQTGPAVDPTAATDFGDSTAFLYTGPDAPQTGVAPGAIEAARVAVLRGRVQTTVGAPLAGVTISILDRPELGQTLSRADGGFDLAVNGGDQVTVEYVLAEHLTAQRSITAPWQEFAWLPDVSLVSLDAQVTTVNLAEATEIQVAQGNPVTDAAGTRQATVLFTPGTAAEMVLPGGATVPLETLNVRATEYTVGSGGPAAMPGELPPTSGYTYAVELSADEVIAAGGTTVRFDQPVPFYVDNFRGFPVGEVVPIGFYDREQGKWVPAPNGLIIGIVSETDGKANIDIDGAADGLAEDDAALAAIGITDAERIKLAALYEPGDSLWRVPLTHFTPWDCNWPYGPPPGADGPRTPPTPRAPTDEKCKKGGSIIECQNQTLGEAVPVTGTPLALHYQSDRVEGGNKGAYTLDIPLTGPTVHDRMRGVTLSVQVAGRGFSRRFGPAPNQTFTYTWDGKDAYGRPVQGEQPVTVNVGYTYAAEYYSSPREFAASFAIPGVSVMRSNFWGAPDITIWSEFRSRLGAWNALGAGLGGWTLSDHHAYDPGGQAVYFGNGERRHLTAMNRITTVAGNGLDGEETADNGVPATAVTLPRPSAVTVGPDGSLYIGTDRHVRRVSPDGIITLVAGGGDLLGDGGQATAARLSQVAGLAVGPDGSLYIADVSQNRIRRVAPDGIITTVAGTGNTDYNGDNGPATQASLFYPRAIAVAPDGTLYIADTTNHRVRRVGTDGIITTFAGTGVAGDAGDGAAAVLAKFNNPWGVALGPDGSLFVADFGNNRVRRIGTDGIIRPVAGTGAPGYEGDGGPATAALLRSPQGLAVSRDGLLYIAEPENNRIRLVSLDGTITTFAGTGNNVYSGDGGPAKGASLYSPRTVAVGPDGGVSIADTYNHRIRRVESPAPISAGGMLLLPSEDGTEVYVFDQSGRHQRTLDPLTGAVRDQFGYSADGLLTTITDVFGNTTTIRRDAAGKPEAIVAPGGQTTGLTLNSAGYLSAITNPESETVSLTYDWGSGLLRTYTAPGGGVWRFTYDGDGRLTKDEDPLGGFKALTRVEEAKGYTVSVTTAGGRVTRYQTQNLPGGVIRRTQTDPNGGVTSVVIRPDGSRTVTAPDGTVSAVVYGPDPRWGMLVPLPVQMTVTSPGGVVNHYARSRTVTLNNPTEPFSIVTMAETIDANGRTLTITYDGSHRIVTTVTAEGRRSSVTLDSNGVVSERNGDLDSGVAPALYTYDRGRLTKLTRGVQAYAYQYDAQNRLVSRTDSEGNETKYTYDNADRLLTATLPGGEIVQYAYDDDGNATQITLPGGQIHRVSYTTTGLATGYTPPGSAVFTTAYDKDGLRTGQTLPGSREISYGLGKGGRPTGLTYDEAAVIYGYAGNTDRVSTIRRTPVARGGGVQALDFAYDGDLITSIAFTGLAQGQYSYRYAGGFLLAGITLDGGPELAITRDADGLVTGYGPFTIARGGPDGAVSQIADNAMVITYGYDQVGNDPEAPTWPDGSQLTASAATPVSVTLNWTGARDNTGINGYRIYRGGQPVATLGGGVRSYTVVEDLVEDTEYTFQVQAGDFSGNWTTDGPTVTARTRVDVAPTWPAGSALTHTDLTAFALTLHWPAAEDDVQVTDYRVYQGDLRLDTLVDINRSFAVTDLWGGTDYTFRVQAVDSKGLTSADLSLSVQTPADQAPTWPAGATLAASNLTPHGLTLTWPAATDDLLVDYYLIYMDGVQWLEVKDGLLSATLKGIPAGGPRDFQVAACDRTGQCTNGPVVEGVTLPVADGLDGELVTLRANLGPAGEEVGENTYTSDPAVSADGRLIVYASNASNLVADDTNNNCTYTHAAPCQDVFVLNTETGVTQRVSLNADGTQRNHPSGQNGLTISADGRYVFYTTADVDSWRSTGLWSYDMTTGQTVEVIHGDIEDPSVSGDGRFVAYQWVTSVRRFRWFDRDTDEDGIYDEPGATGYTQLPSDAENRVRFSRDGEWIIYTGSSGGYRTYAYHRSTGTVTMVSTTANGTAVYGGYPPDISANGRYVLFTTDSASLGMLGPGALVLHDRDADEDGIYDEPGAIANSQVNLAHNGQAPSDRVDYAWRMGGDGRYVAFLSRASNLVAHDTNEDYDLFVRDMQAGQTVLVSRSTAGVQIGWEPDEIIGVSDDGRTVVYASSYGFLVPGDKNGRTDIFYTTWVSREAPTWPDDSSLVASNVTTTSLTLTWTPAQDNAAVASYVLYQGAAQLAVLTGDQTTYNVTGLTPNTAYSFQVKAVDASDQWAPQGPSVSVSTLPHLTPPVLKEATVRGALLTLRFDEALDESSVPALSDFVIGADGAPLATAQAVAVLGNRVCLMLADDVSAGAAITLDYTAGAAPIRDLYVNAAPNLVARPVINWTGMETVPPSLVKAPLYWGHYIELTYDEPLDEAAVPDASDFGLHYWGDPAPDHPVSVQVTGSRVILAVPRPDNKPVGLDYTRGANPLRDLAGNEAAELAGAPVGWGLSRVSEGPASALGAAAPATLLVPQAPSGRLINRAHTVGGQETYNLALTYDNLGRITSRVETVAGTEHIYAYTYDANGQLTKVTRDGAPVESYLYDANGNRRSRTVAGSAEVTATFDAQGRITGNGSTVYQFNAAGFLTRRGQDSFEYSTRGELLKATLAGGQVISYGYDGLARRVSRTDGSGTYQYLYGNPGNPFQVTDVRDPAGVLSTYFYDDAGILYAFRRGTDWYYVAADQVGTPRVITDAKGQLVKSLTYDSFGVLLEETQPGFHLPFGFAGGLADPATGLVRFGYRDYEPATGRWTARDPLLFKAGQVNLYGYVGNNPISLVDPTGLFCIGFSAYAGVGGGIKLCTDGDKFGICGEVGFGVGGGVEVDITGDPEDGSKIKLEGKCQAGPGSGGGSITFDECGFKPEAKICGGPLCLKATPDDVGVTAESYEFGMNCDAKLAGEVCGKW